MPDNGHDLPWSEEQWATVQRTVLEAANKARVASSFLPLFGPLAPGQTTVPALRMLVPRIPAAVPYDGAANRLAIDDGATLRLTTIACNVYLTTQEAEDPELAAAQQMLCRAAALIGRLEDAIVFNGQPGQNQLPLFGVPPQVGLLVTVQGGQPARTPGLDAPLGGRAEVPIGGNPGTAAYSDQLVVGVVQAIQTLEGGGQYGPFACVLGDTLYAAANRPSQFQVLPSDRIVPFLGGGPLLRSSALRPDRGVVVALAGWPIDLVVGSDVHVQYLQRSVEPRYVLRVSERFVLRIRQPRAVCGLRPPTNAEATAERATIKAEHAKTKAEHATEKAEHAQAKAKLANDEAKRAKTDAEKTKSPDALEKANRASANAERAKDKADRADAEAAVAAAQAEDARKEADDAKATADKDGAEALEAMAKAEEADTKEAETPQPNNNP